MQFKISKALVGTDTSAVSATPRPAIRPTGKLSSDLWTAPVNTVFFDLQEFEESNRFLFDDDSGTAVPRLKQQVNGRSFFAPIGRKLLEALERWVYRSAAGIVVNTLTFHDHITTRGVAGDSIELVYNGIDPAMFKPRPKNLALLARHGLADRFTVAYVGTLGLAHGLTLLVDVAERLAARSEIQFVLIGDGADREKLEAEVARRGLRNFHMLGLQPRDAMPDWIASIDVLLVMLRDLPVFETVIPSKIFEFLAQERPVILAAKGEIRRMMAEADGALIIDPEVADQLVAAIEDVIARPNEARLRAAAGRRFVEGGFLRDDLARKMSAFLERVIRDSA